MRTGPRRHLEGPPFALPRPLDALVERWWAARPRMRALLALTGLAVVVLAGLAHAAAAPHGPPADVLVARRDLPVGHVIGRSDVDRTTWPQDLIPDGAIHQPTGVVRAPLPRGAVVTDRHLGDDGLTAGLPDGTAAVAVPVDAVPSLRAGTNLDLVAVDLDGRATSIATGAVVVAVDDTAVWIAVERTQAAGVAGAATAGALGVVVVPPTSR